MSGRALIVLAFKADRDRAHRWIDGLPVNSRIEFKEPKRSIPQSDKMWASLTDIAEQVPWHGIKLSAEDWKLIFLDGLKREVRLVPNLDETGFVNLGKSSSDLSKDEMSMMIELIHSFGANHKVTFHEPAKPEEA